MIDLIVERKKLKEKLTLLLKHLAKKIRFNYLQIYRSC